jgi:ABC-type transport system involved in multi-copper enzyme maturation permease subunit
MLRDIIKKEILDHLLSAKFVFMFIICFVLILLSVYMGVAGYLADKKVYDDDIAWDAQAWQPPNTYNILLQGSLKVYRAPQTLGTLIKGVEDAAGRVSHTVLDEEVSLGESKYQSNPLTAVFGAFDLMFIVKMAFSLFAILLIYDTICGEKEKGTLKLALSNSLPRDRLLLGKAIGGYISLCVPLLIPLLFSLIYLSMHPSIVLTGEDWQRLGFIFLLFLLYLTVFFCLGMLVSSLTARSSTSLLILLFIWSVWGIVVPKASVIFAGMLRPIPVANEI